MVIRRPPSRLDYARYARWVGASHALAGILPALVPVIQGLGKIDAELDAEDSAYARRQTSAAKSSADLARFRLQESDRLTDRVNLSALWLLGAYEVARTLDEALRTGAHELPARLRQGVKVARLQLERPRMLLAKQTPARRQRSTDEAPAKPYILQGSMAWKVAPRKLISRRALADGFLEALEQLGVHHKRPPNCKPRCASPSDRPVGASKRQHREPHRCEAPRQRTDRRKNCVSCLRTGVRNAAESCRGFDAVLSTS
jgi:hypothetical protein